MTETTHPSPPRASRPYRQRGTLLQRRGRTVLVIALFIGVALGYALGYLFAHQDLKSSKQLVAQLQSEGQRLKKQVVALTASQATVQAELAQMRAAMHAMKPVADTYNVDPNQSLVLQNGRIAIGLVGTPNNDNIKLNVNGKQYTAVSGDVIEVPPDCRVEVQSFDMFKAVIHATCGPAK